MAEKYPSLGPAKVKALNIRSGDSRKRPDQPCSSSSLQSKRSRENSDIGVPLSRDPIKQLPSVSSLGTPHGPISDPFTPDIKPQNVAPHSTIDQMKSPTPMTSGQKLEVSDLKPTLETTDQKPVLTSPTQPGPPSYTTIPKHSPSTLSQAPSLTLPPLTTPGEPTQPVSVPPVSTPVERGAPSTKDSDLCEPKIEHSGDEVDQRECVNRAVQRTIEVLVHASQCKERNCKNRSCMKMKQVIFHVRRCRTCPICKQFLQLCLQHAKQCMDEECTVPLCANLKRRIEERQRGSQINQNRG